jgi:hypothetical protein
MMHLPREQFTVEDVRALCRSTNTFRPLAAEFETMVGTKDGLRKVQQRLYKGIRGKGPAMKRDFKRRGEEAEEEPLNLGKAKPFPFLAQSTTARTSLFTNEDVRFG